VSREIVEHRAYLHRQRPHAGDFVAEDSQITRPERLLRLTSIIGRNGLIPVSRSTWWAGVKTGRFPKPTYVLGPRLPTWRASEIEALINARSAEPMPNSGPANTLGGTISKRRAVSR
jgi:prophage regulatory protein